VDTPGMIFTQTNRELKMSKAQHFVLSYEFLPTEDIRFKAEIYYQHLYDIPVTQNPGYYSSLNYGAEFNITLVDSLVNKGVGRNYGMELTLEKFFSKNYYFLVTASMFQSEYRGSDNTWRNTAFNTNFVYNALAGKEFKTGKRKDNILALNLKITYAGGRRYVPIDEQKSALFNAPYYDESRAYEQRNPSYFRTDFRISFRKNSRRIAQEWALDVQNIFNTQNLLIRQWNYLTGKMENLYQIGIFPVPFYRIYF
jgi:hypothetical protein